MQQGDTFLHQYARILQYSEGILQFAESLPLEHANEIFSEFFLLLFAMSE